jgi:two-component system sensor histidine kinase MprB
VSLQRRISAAVAVGVTLIVSVLAVIEYVSVRSHLRGEIDSALVQAAKPFLGPHDEHGGPGPGGGGHGGPPPEDMDQPRGELGGAAGIVQFVRRDGTVVQPGGGTGALFPPGARATALARAGRGRYYSEATVKRRHLRILTIADSYDQTAVQVARPLTEVDSVLRQLTWVFAAVIGAGIFAAAALGGLIGRAALAPIRRFIRRTESITEAPDTSQRLEEGGPSELARLATSFNQTLDALERSVQAQRHLVADASHELRTPIAALRSNIQIFLQSGRLPVAEREGLQAAIIAELDELTQVVTDVLELARGSGPGEADDELRLDAVVSEAIERTRRRAPELAFEVELEPTLVRHDPDSVARAVVNVLDNARKWSPPGGRVDVRLADGVLSVRDHGPGFGADDLPHVFDRFYRAPGARRLPGSGLGLAIVRQAAESRRGFAQADNAPDGGAIVRISFGPTLPVAPARTAAGTAAGRTA